MELAPTLGPQLADWIQKYGVHGPGDVAGVPFRFSNEELSFLYEAYELKEDPFDFGHWRRVYQFGAYSRRKGLRKSELLGLISFAEFDGPVRFDHWAKKGEVSWWGYAYDEGEPVGRRVTSPEIPVVATSEDQAERLVWGVIRFIMMNSPLKDRYDILEDVIRFKGQPKEDGWMYLVPPNNTSALDGAKPTFTPREEAHLWKSRKLHEAADFLDRNSAKRKIADPWTMDASTAYSPGEMSVLESLFKASEAGAPGILIDHLEADLKWNLDDETEWLEAVREASGDGWPWTNVDALRTMWLDPRKTEASFRRFQLNQCVGSDNKPFSGDMFDVFEDRKRTPSPSKKTSIVLCLDGSTSFDSTALVAWTLDERPHLFIVDLWEREDATRRESWSVPKVQVVNLVEQMIDDFDVVLLVGDSDRFWSPQLVEWEQKFGADVVVHFPTRQGKLMGNAVDNFTEEFAVGLARHDQGAPTGWTHDGSARLRRHFANTLVQKGNRSTYNMLAKATDGNEDKIDAAVASVMGFAMIPAARAALAERKPTGFGIY